MNDQPSLAESPTTHSLFASLMALAPMNDVQVIPAEAATAVERLAVLRDISANVTARTRHWVERAREDGSVPGEA